MQHEILVNSSPLETRVAILECGLVQDVFFERVNRPSVVGNIYLGQVIRVLPGMQACFVDIGLERSALLHARDLLISDGNYDLSINRLVCEGQYLLVQVIKDPVKAKGARLTTEISLAARHLILMPFSTHIGVSQRIKDKGTRTQLKSWASKILESFNLKAGLIIRTAGDCLSTDDFANELEYLERIWKSIQSAKKNAKASMLLMADLRLIHRLVRDHIRRDTSQVWIDSIETFDQIKRFAQKHTPDIVNSIRLYEGERPLFDQYQVDDEIKKASRPLVELKSGAYLTIDHTEALTAIDINTGRFVGIDTLEQTILKTNLEASEAIGRQIRLRNLSGTIVVDYIHMTDDEHKRQVLDSLRKSLDSDPTKTRIAELNDTGLVMITRKRTRESLSEALQEDCANCKGTGKTITAAAVCYDIFRDILKEMRAHRLESPIVIAAPEVIERLMGEESDALAELEGVIHRPIKLQIDTKLAQGRYEVVVS